MLRAMRAENGVGSASASSSALVCSDWVWPCVAAIASIWVRTMLLNGSCAVSDQPEVWQWVRSGSDFSDFGLKPLTRLAHSSRAARSLAISMKKFMPIAQKNDRRGANSIDAQARRDAGAQILDAVGERIGELEVLRRAGLLHVIAGDRDRIEFRHVFRREGEDVGDDAHRGARADRCRCCAP